MKFKMYRILLSLFFALGLVFSFSIDASGTHDEDDTRITAEQVAADPGNEPNMMAFVNHIVDYYNGIRIPSIDNLEANRAELIRKLTIFARDIRRGSEDGGVYKHGDIYAIGINDSGIVTNHAGYHGLIGYRVNRDAQDSDILDTLTALLDDPYLEIGEPPVCQDYSENRVACAAKVKSDFTVDVTNIVGLLHEGNDSAFIPPDCEGLSLGTTAEDVFKKPSDANLEAYVKDAIEAIQEDVKKISEEEAGKLIQGDPSLFQDQVRLAELAEGPITTRIQERLFCFGSGDFKHENIYLFVMGADLENSTVIVNGNNFDLNGGNLELEDDELEGEDKTIASLFNRELAGGTSTYVNYRWDNPSDPDDDVENFFEDKKVPGTSPKRSYIEVANLNEKLPQGTPEDLYIFGSGTYPEDDDGACAIAGASNTSQGALLNLFLIASILFSVVFLRRRA